MPRAQAPCLVIHAQNGSMFEPQTECLAEELSDAKIVPIEGIFHFPIGSDNAYAQRVLTAQTLAE